jgi:FkbM family methyltransferase
MNKIHREGVDINTAFLAAAKRLRYSASRTKASILGRQEDINFSNSASLFSRGGIKGTLRSIGQFGFRLAKPIFRPIAFRLRRYLIEGLRQDILQEIQRTSATNVQELQAIRKSLRQEVAHSLDVSRQEIQKGATTIAAPDLQAVRESLRQEIADSLGMLRQELQIRNDALVPRLDRIEQYSYATARRVAITCDSGEVLVRTEVGFVLCAATDHAMLACLVDTGELELGTRLLIQKFLKPGDVYVDVGANIGMHVLAAARAMQGQGKIIAFEPFEPTKRMLEKTVRMNGFSDMTEIHQAAVSNVSGRQNLYLGVASGHHSLFKLDTSEDISKRPVEVALVRMDEVMPSKQRINLLKIDAEGAELDVVESSASLIRNNPDIALIVEFGPSHLRRTGHTPKQWLGTFTKLGLNYQVINVYSGTLEAWPIEQLEQVDSVNLFFSRDNSQAWSRLKA